jgi:hypothetical protein
VLEFSVQQNLAVVSLGPDWTSSVWEWLISLHIPCDHGPDCIFHLCFAVGPSGASVCHLVLYSFINPHAVSASVHGGWPLIPFNCKQFYFWWIYIPRRADLALASPHMAAFRSSPCPSGMDARPNAVIARYVAEDTCPSGAEGHLHEDWGKISIHMMLGPVLPCRCPLYLVCLNALVFQKMSLSL